MIAEIAICNHGNIISDMAQITAVYRTLEFARILHLLLWAFKNQNSLNPIQSVLFTRQRQKCV